MRTLHAKRCERLPALQTRERAYHADCAPVKTQGRRLLFGRRFPGDGPGESVHRTGPGRDDAPGTEPQARGRRGHLVANEVRDAKDSLSTLLYGISGLKILYYPAGSVNEFRSAVVLFDSCDAAQAMSGSSFAGRIKVLLRVSSADTKQAYYTLDAYMALLRHHRRGCRERR